MISIWQRKKFFAKKKTIDQKNQYKCHAAVVVNKFLGIYLHKAIFILQNSMLVWCSVCRILKFCVFGTKFILIITTFENYSFYFFNLFSFGKTNRIYINHSRREILFLNKRSSFTEISCFFLNYEIRVRQTITNLLVYCQTVYICRHAAI